ncbi:MAG: hypothetical protein Q4C01_05285 [Clostridia bacterium]|nr:hypothetical protein [Clostridia bacterium]
MKKFLLLILSGLLLILGCSDADNGTVQPTAEPSQQIQEGNEQQRESLSEDEDEPYLNPLSELEIEQDEVFDYMRLDMPLPENATDATFKIVTTRHGLQAAEARFYVGYQLYYYRIAYTEGESNIADDELAYRSITSEQYGEQEYLLCLNTGAGRVQWYDELSGTSRSLYCPIGLSEEGLLEVAHSIMDLS